MGTTLFVIVAAIAVGLGIALFLQASTNDKLEVENAKLKSANQGLMAETNRLRTQTMLGSEKVKVRDVIIESLTNGYEGAQKKITELETTLSKLPAKDPKTGKFVSKKPKAEKVEAAFKNGDALLYYKEAPEEAGMDRFIAGKTCGLFKKGFVVLDNIPVPLIGTCDITSCFKKISQERYERLKAKTLKPKCSLTSELV